MKNTWTGVGGKTNFEEDIHTSCCREIHEETGLEVTGLTLKGVVKTILHNADSSWLLFVYTAKTENSNVKKCDEGTLSWVPIDDALSYNLIGFIRSLFPHIIDSTAFFEGTLVHNQQGDLITSNIAVQHK